MARVIFSAGHSPVDKGAVIGDLVEYDLTTKIIDAFEPLITKYKKLEPKRIPTGLSLPQKIQWINGTGYTSENNDIAVEIHINDADGSEDGIECWHAERGENASNVLCTKLMHSIARETGMRERSVKSEYDHPFRRLGYVHNTTTISALLEVGFMDNPKDKKILTTDAGVEKIAKGLLIGVLDYYGLKEGDFDKEPELKPAYPIHTDPNPSTYSGPMPNMNALAANMGNTAQPQASFPSPNPTLAGIPSAVPNSLPSSTPATVDEKKNLVTRLYQKVLGRNPDPRGLQYYANSQMSEEALMKLMIDSAEHKNIIKAARDYVSTKSLLDKREREIKELKAKINDKDEEIQSLTQYFQKVKDAVTETPDIAEDSGPDRMPAFRYSDESYPSDAKMQNSINISKDKANQVRRKRLPRAFQAGEAIEFAKGILRSRK